MRRALSFLAAITWPRRVFLWAYLAYFAVGLGLTALVPHAERSVFDLGFGFGPAALSVAKTGALADATRMPLIPYLLGALARLNTSVPFALIVKNVLTGALFGHVLWRATAEDGGKRGAVAVAVFVMSFPSLTRIVFALVPEEAYLAALVAFLFDGLLRVTRGARVRSVVPYALACGAAYLTKSSLLLFCPVVALLFAWRTRRPLVLATFAGVLGVAALVWALAIVRTSGELHATSSLDGYNFWKGNNASTLTVYPERSLDFISSLAPEASPDESEWAWSRRCFREGLAFDTQHPTEAARIFGSRVYRVFFAVLEEEPVEETPLHRLWRWASVPHMVAFRVLSIAAIAFAIRDVVQRFRDRASANASAADASARAACYLVFVFAFVAPFLAAWAAGRHVLPLVLPTLLFARGRFSASAI